jgi:MoxR-like ATPase
VVKLLKLFAASAYLDRRPSVDPSDFFVLKHVWNTEEQASILEGLVQPVLDAFFREQPDRKRVGALGVGVQALAAEVERIRQVLFAGKAPSDIQLFTQLKALGEVRSALAQIPEPEARDVERRVRELLDASLSSGRFSTL